MEQYSNITSWRSRCSPEYGTALIMRIRRTSGTAEDEFVSVNEIAMQNRGNWNDDSGETSKKRFPRRISLVTMEEIIVGYLSMRRSA